MASVALPERIKAFLAVGYGSGSGSGAGNGSGSGSGYGYGSGSGAGNGYGSGSGSGAGNGYGSGNGNGSGNGYGSGSGYGAGNGYGSGNGNGVTRFNGQPVYEVDGVQTVITSVKGNLAKGFMLGSDLVLKPCWIAKDGDHFAHGETAESAAEDARLKHLEDMPTEDRIAEFWQCHDRESSYPASDFFDWHGRLTGSCRAGREQFMRDKGLSLDQVMTVEEFVALTKGSYGGEVIAQLV